MRIAFKPSLPNNENVLRKTVDDYDLIDSLNPLKVNHFTCFNIFDIQTYTDNSRYELNLFKVDFNQKPSNHRDLDKARSGCIQVIRLDLNFDINFNFELLSPRFADLWNNDIDTNFIRPHGYCPASRDNISYYVFKSIASNYFAKALNLISSNNIICFKYNRKIIFAYNLCDQNTINNLNDILDYFLDAIYELVNICIARLNLTDIPEEAGRVNVNMQDFYKKKRK